VLIAMAADDVTNVKFGFKQFVTAESIYAATTNKSFMTMDNNQ